MSRTQAQKRDLKYVEETSEFGDPGATSPKEGFEIVWTSRHRKDMVHKPKRGI